VGTVEALPEMSTGAGWFGFAALPLAAIVGFAACHWAPIAQRLPTGPMEVVIDGPATTFFFSLKWLFSLVTSLLKSSVKKLRICSPLMVGLPAVI